MCSREELSARTSPDGNQTLTAVSRPFTGLSVKELEI
jgi:hypothetical protein